LVTIPRWPKKSCGHSGDCHPGLFLDDPDLSNCWDFSGSRFRQLVPAGNEKTSGEKLAEQIFQAMVGDWLGTSIGTWDISLW